MPFRVFQYPLPTEPELPDLNAFLGTEKVAMVQHHIVTTSNGAWLVFVVETVGQRIVSSSGGSSSTPKVDYRAVLDDDQFALFSRLRTTRKEIAESEGVPVYTVFTNAQLAEMVQRRVTSPTELMTIAGVGQLRADKYGERFLTSLADALGEQPEPSA